MTPDLHIRKEHLCPDLATLVSLPNVITLEIQQTVDGWVVVVFIALTYLSIPEVVIHYFQAPTSKEALHRAAEFFTRFKDNA